MEQTTSQSLNASSSDGFTRFYIEPYGAQVVRLAMEAAIFVLGVVGNILVCVVVIREKLTRSLAYCLILNLAVADLGLLLFSLPFALLRTEDVSWPLGEFSCTVLYPLSDIFPAASIASITAIALYRYLGIVKGQTNFRRQRALKQAWIVVSLIWLLSFLLFVVPLFFAMTFATVGGRSYCFPQFSDQLYFDLYQAEAALLTYVLPLAIILFTYLAIRRRLQESIELHVNMRKESRSTRRSQDNKTLKALKVISPVVLVFTITMLPYNAFRVVDMVADTHDFEYLLLFFKLCVLFFVANSSANPLIYAVVSDDFRKAFRWHLCRCLRTNGDRKLFSFADRIITLRTNVKRSIGRQSTQKTDRQQSDDVFVWENNELSFIYRKKWEWVARSFTRKDREFSTINLKFAKETRKILYLSHMEA